MKVSLNWLRSYVDVPEGIEEFSNLLTFAGVEVEGVEKRGSDIANVVVAQIVESEKHPNADRLSVCRVDDGSGTLRQIVCGAKNFKPGDKVPLAQPGAVLPGNFKIKVGKLRGVESQGMLCSAKELELADDADGLLILPQDAPVGKPLSSVIKPDTIFEIEVTPNRPDLLGYLGIAREVGALLGKPVSAPAIPPVAPAAGESIEVLVEDAERCPLYTARRIAGVKVGPSPEWLRERLKSAGLRPINNVVDVTNFVLLETGQPLHAFDAKKLEGGIHVRTARDGERFVALDGNTYFLRPDDLVIADATKAVAIAGVMGGEESGVTESTTEIILESAVFAPVSVRRTSRGLGLSSDSSYRFERGVDRGGVLRASDRAATLILELAGGEIQSEPTIAGSSAAPEKVVALRYQRCRDLMGAPISNEEIDRILSGFGLQKENPAEDRADWRIPSSRQDLTREIDLIEEVTRVYGLERVPEGRCRRVAPESEEDRRYDRRMRLARMLAGWGFQEVRTPTLISERMLQDALQTLDPLERLRNPLTEEMTVLRPDLAPGLIAVASHNARHGNANLRLFEMGRVYGGAETEEPMIGILMTGAANEEDWRGGTARQLDFFDLTGVLESLGLTEVEWRPASHETSPLYAEVVKSGNVIGYAAVMPPQRAAECDLPETVLLAAVKENAVLTASESPSFREWDRYPSVTRDIALVAPDKLTHREIVAALAGASEPLLKGVKLFDVFADPTGQKVPINHRSLAYSLTYRSNERTLTVDEVTAAHTRLKDLLKSKLGVLLRE
jgi:phenylalanyl-tRNA synthetase beta chain